MTKLEKDITRETTIMINNKPIIITITKEQKLSLKLKGEKKKKEINIIELFDILNNNNIKNIDKDEKLISVNELRTKYIISKEFDYDTKVKLEKITLEILKNI